MVETPHARDAARRVPVYSLYSETREPTAEMLKDVDVLVVDLQDVGSRIYTFIYTMAQLPARRQKHGVPVIVCDRPNPIGGVSVGGPMLVKGYESFVGQFPIPLRHGMTIGELARFFNEACGIGADSTVVPMEHWQRSMYFDDTGIPWVMPSPNMPTLDTAIVYPGTVLFEGTNLSEGRGTTRPFELIGAPWVDAEALAARLTSHDMPGVHFRATVFEPTFQKHARQAVRRRPDSRARSGSVSCRAVGRGRAHRNSRAEPLALRVAAAAVRIREGEAAVRHPGRLERAEAADRSGHSAANDLRRLAGRPRQICAGTRAVLLYKDDEPHRGTRSCRAWRLGWIGTREICWLPATRMAIAWWPPRSRGHRCGAGRQAGTRTWTAREIVHHLADSEMTSAVRLRLLVAEDHARNSAVRSGAVRAHAPLRSPHRHSMLAFQAARASSGELLDRLTEAEWAKAGTHPEHDRYGVERWLEIYADHAHNHADQIRRARASAGR